MLLRCSIDMANQKDKYYNLYSSMSAEELMLTIANCKKRKAFAFQLEMIIYI